MSSSIAQLFVTLGIDDSGFQTSLKTLQSQMTAAGKEMTLIGGTITAALTGAVANFTSTGAAIDEMSDKTGMSTETISALKYAAEQTGGSIDDLGTSVKAMQKNIADLSGSNADPTTAIQKATDGLTTAQNNLALAQMKLTDLQTKGTPTALQLQAAHDAVTAATLRVTDSQNNLVLAQAKLTSIQNDSKSTALQIQAAQNAVTAAMDSNTTAQNSLALAQMKLTDLNTKGAPTALQLATAQDAVTAATFKVTEAQDKLTTAQSGGATTAGVAQKAIKDLGLNLADLQAMTPDQQFTTLANAIANVKDPTEKAALSMAIFGKSGTDMLPMLADGSTGLQTMMERAKDLGVVFDQTAADKAVKMKQGMNDIKTSMQGLADNIGSTLVPILIPLVQKITSIVEGITNWAKAHPELTKVILVVVGTLGALMAIIGPFLLALPLIAESMGIIIGLFKAWEIGTKLTAAAQWLWNAAMDANPIALIIIAVVALIAIVVLLIKNWSTVSDFFSGLWDDVLGFFKKVWDWLGDNWPYFLGLPGLIIKNWGTISGFFSKMWDDIKTGFKDAVNFLIGLAEGWVNIWIKGINLIIGALDGIKITIPDWIPGIGGKSFGIDISPLPEISLPRLAAGGIVTSATMALIGEAGPEAVIPLDKLGNGGAGGYKTANIYLMLDGRKLANILGQPLVDEIRLRTGIKC